MRWLILLLLLIPRHGIAQNQYSGAMKATGQALYIKLGLRDWVNDKKNWIKQRSDDSPAYALAYAGVLLGTFAAEKRYTIQMKGFRKNHTISSQLGLTPSFRLDERYNVAYIITF